MKLAQQASAQAARVGQDKKSIRVMMSAVVENPQTYLEHELLGSFAVTCQEVKEIRARFDHRQDPAPYRSWRTDLEPGAVEQMENACRLPV